MTDGRVPVVQLIMSKNKQIVTTIRHNRARGSHLVLKMADIIHELLDKGNKMDWEEVEKALGMEWEEIDRGSKEELNKGWVAKRNG